LPPMTADRSQVIPNVPLVEWPVFGKYNSAADCEKRRVWLLGQLDRNFIAEAAHRDEVIKEVKALARCIEVEQLAPKSGRK
jgi:hypothetical protein